MPERVSRRLNVGERVAVRVARLVLATLVLLVATPGAAAWEARLAAHSSEVSLAESLLLAGAIDATVPDGGTFGAPYARVFAFDGLADVRVCPDQAGEPQASPQCVQAEDTTGIDKLRINAGGVVARLPAGPIALRANATAAALGGPNVTIGRQAIGPAIVVGGDAYVVAEGNALIVRPLLANASIEVRGNEGFRVYNGTGYTMFVSGDLTKTKLEASGAFLAGEGLDVAVSRSTLVAAETSLVVEHLFTTLREIQAPERADRRASIARAFGPFQLVPALLNGAAAAQVNLTLNGAPRDAFTFVRLQDGRFTHDGANWTGSGNATYLVDGETVAPAPSRVPVFPYWLPILLVVAALAGRALSDRDPPRRRARYVALALRLAGLAGLMVLAAARLAPLFGFSPLLDARELSLRSRTQLALLVLGMVATAYLAVGIPLESVARSIHARMGRRQALLVPVLAGLLGALVFVLLATPTLLSFVARYVRL